jgi:hypothetical protein
MIENLLCLLLEVCKRELQKPETPASEVKLSRMMSDSAEKSSPKALEAAKNYVTPYIRKSVSIIVSFERFCLIL